MDVENLDMLKYLAGGAAGIILSVVVYFGKRWIEGAAKTENLSLKERVLRIAKELEERHWSLGELHHFEDRLLDGQSLDRLTEAVAVKHGEPVVTTQQSFGRLYELLAIHAGNDARDAGLLRELSPDLVTENRLDLARAIFHAAIRMTRSLIPDSANLPALEEYEQDIPVPESYKDRLKRFP